ncbi:MAG: VIT and VWA domain-containing protein [Butyrivibrio sp.]|nr:VIT and VWA domain-containing protein [Acetatifactor muris]MCM1558820.1 VIT and VWA domain-containing protein [Butyrivibrio sp.]
MRIMREKRITDKIRKRICCLLALLLFAASCPGVYAAEETAAEEDGSEESDGNSLLAPYFIVQGTENDALATEHFPLKATNVVSNINGIIAETYVTQTYANEGDIPINASYVFPASSDVTVHGMKMVIGNEMITAQIREKETAKKEYTEAKSEGKSASLMEQKRPNVFTMDVANIMPGDIVNIELHYTQLITPEENTYEFVFPTVVGPRYTPPASSEPPADNTGSDDKSSENGSSGEDWTASPYLPEGVTPPGDYNITVNLSTGVPIADITSKSHGVKIVKSNDSTARITLMNPDDYAGNRDFILKYRLTGGEIQSGLVLSGGEDENFFMLTIQPPERYAPEDLPPREYIFVLDVSGSMFGYPLDTAKALVRDLVTDLKETDTFNLVLFANDSTLLSSGSLTATPQNVSAAIQMIDEQNGGGGTSLLPALQDALAIPKEDNTARSIVIITDGYISNDNEVISCVTENMNKASFFSFGIGTSVNDYLIKQIAGCGLGESFIVTDSEDAADSAARFRTYIEAPLLTDISVAFQNFQVYDVEPSVPSILYAAQPIVLFGKWRGNPMGTVTVTGKAGKEDYIQEIPVNTVEVDRENEAIRYLWARTHLDRIAGYGSVRNDASVKDEITRIGLEYNMITPYTSFVAVSEIIRNPAKDSTDVDQALPLPQRVSGLAVGGGYRAYSEPELLFLLLPAAAIFLRRTVKAKRTR